MDNSHEDKLFKAVQEYVEAKGGGVAVASGPEIHQWPNAPRFAFTVVVKCTGRKPRFARGDAGGEDT